jgi:hypothetical protein
VKQLVRPFALPALRKVAHFEMLPAMLVFLWDIYLKLNVVKKRLPLNFLTQFVQH